MTDYSQALELYISLNDDNEADGIDVDLINAVVDKMGGEDLFLENFKRVVDDGSSRIKLDGFLSKSERYDFYTEHKEEILKFCGDNAWRENEQSALQLVMKRLGHEAYTYDQLARGLFGATIESISMDIVSGEVCDAAVYYLVDEVCTGFNQMLIDGDNHPEGF